MVIKMEEQIVKITIHTKGEKCEMKDEEICAWYEKKISELFNPELGTPEIEVHIERNEY